MLDLLQAVADGKISRDSPRFDAPYLLEGQPIERMQLWWLKRRAWIDLPLSGPPKITEDGTAWLRAKKNPANPDQG